MHALMVGCGNMGGALLTQWSTVDRVTFTVVDPALPVVPVNVSAHASIESVTHSDFDLLIVAVKPQRVDALIPQYADKVAEAGVAMSIAAGYSSARLSELLGDRPVIRVMPNMPAAIGKGVSGMYATGDTPEDARNLVLELMRATGEVVQVSEEDSLDKVTAIAGSGPGYVFEIAHSYVEAAKSLGFDEAAARTLVLGTLSGAVEMALRSDDSLKSLRNAVTSKAGTTEAGLNALNGDGTLSRILNDALAAAYARAVELR